MQADLERVADGCYSEACNRFAVNPTHTWAEICSRFAVIRQTPGPGSPGSNPLCASRLGSWRPLLSSTHPKASLPLSESLPAW